MSTSASALTSAQQADNRRRRQDRLWTFFVVLLIVGLFYWAYKDPDFFAGTVHEQAQRKATADRKVQIANMDCSDAMKAQIDLVTAGKGAEARELRDSVDRACTSTSETVTKFVLILVACAAGLVFIVLLSAPQF